MPMEPDEICVVLARASELHTKINDAIERATKREFLLCTGPRSPPADADNASASPTSSSQGYGVRRYDSSAEDTSTIDGSVEARSLGAIRDALEVLEVQLDSLRKLQQQQRGERDTALADLEESRRILLRRLKDHRGREWEVVLEALAFAGEPVDDRDDLPLPPYPMPLPETTFQASLEDQSPPYDDYPNRRGSGGIKILSLLHEEKLKSAGEGSADYNQEGTSSQVEQGSKDGGGFLGIPVSLAKFSGAVLGQAFGLTTKAALVVVSVLAALAVSEMSHRFEKRREGLTVLTRQLPSSQSTEKPIAECPPGKKLIVEDGLQKCVVKERVELPFPREIKTPDVLYGRG